MAVRLNALKQASAGLAYVGSGAVAKECACATFCAGVSTLDRPL